LFVNEKDDINYVAFIDATMIATYSTNMLSLSPPRLYPVPILRDFLAQINHKRDINLAKFLDEEKCPTYFMSR
jgi:hypothetical protein